ncbi:MAG TPA: 4,5-DOPA dioxygenase extradiol [Caulobacteraceae bacterium]|jgi:4,5-DOPA dioxygenase extradiol
MSSSKAPALFIGHGSPLTAFSDNAHVQAWRALGAELETPKAILAVSAHWWIPETAATAMERPRTIHDFGGFPAEMYEARYPAPGSSPLAERVADLLAPTPVRRDLDWGLDHGAWAPLMHLFPKADVPVVQLSLDSTRDGAWHWEQAERLRPLRDEGVLVLASGVVVHNLRRIDRRPAAPEMPWARAFSDRIAEALEAGDRETLVNWRALPDAEIAAPDPDHFLPLLYAAALRGPGEPIRLFDRTLEMGSLDMTSAVVGRA